MPLLSERMDSEVACAVPAGTVLVVEDPLVSKLVRAVLQRHGYAVRLAAQAEAIGLLRVHGSQVGVLLTNAPGAFLEFAGQVPLLYLTSSPDILLQAPFRSSRAVVKPFVPEELAQAVGELIGVA